MIKSKPVMNYYVTGNHDVSFDQRRDENYRNDYYLKQKQSIEL